MTAESSYRLLRIDPRGDAVVVTFIDCKVIDERKAALLSSELNRFVDGLSGPCRLHLDLGGVDYLTSTMLGELVALNKRLKSLSGMLALCNATPPVAQIFDVTHMGRLIDIIPGSPPL